MDINPFRVGIIVGIKNSDRVFKIKRMAICEEQLNEFFYPGMRDFYIELLLGVHHRSTYPKWKLPQLTRVAEAFKIGSNTYQIDAMLYSIDNSMEIRLKTCERL